MRSFYFEACAVETKMESTKGSCLAWKSIGLDKRHRALGELGNGLVRGRIGKEIDQFDTPR